MKKRENLDETLGSKLKGYRKKQGMTQQQLAGLVGISHVQIARYESGSSMPNNRIINKLTIALELPQGTFDTQFENETFNNELLKASFEAVEILPEPDKIMIQAIIDRFLLFRGVKSLVKS